MRLKYAFAALTAASVGALSLTGCTEPKAPPSFQGTITSIVVVKDVFQNTETMSLKVDLINAGDEECRLANVRLTASTLIHTTGSPDVVLGPDFLKVGQDIQVIPTAGSQLCPLEITATEIVINATFIIKTGGAG